MSEGATRLLVLAAENLDEVSARALETLAPGKATLILSAQRLRRLGVERSSPGLIALPNVDLDRVAALLAQEDAHIDAPVKTPGPAAEAALDILRLANLLPGAILAPLEKPAPELQSVRAATSAPSAPEKSRRCIWSAARRRRWKARRIPSSWCFAAARVCAIRRRSSSANPISPSPVNVRLHSACLTGDLFGSLKCDCGDQLRHTARFMAENGGGVILYLDQEGRGNGLANKIRAYRVAGQGPRHL